MKRFVTLATLLLGSAAAADAGWSPALNTELNDENVTAVGSVCDSLFLGGNVSSGMASQQQVFVARYNVLDRSQTWRQEFGGDQQDELRDLEVDANGDVWVAGVTRSSDFLGLSTGARKYSGFIFRLDGKSGQVLTKQVVGGATLADVTLHCVLPNPAGGAWFCGTSDANTETLGPAGPFGNTARGTADAIVGAIGDDGTIPWVNYFGGMALDRAVDLGEHGGELVVLGETYSTTDFEPSNETFTQNSQLFFIGMSPSGQVHWSHLAGGPFTDVPAALVASGGALLAAATTTGEFPIFDGGTSASGLREGIVASVSDAGLIWAVPVGGNARDDLYALTAVDGGVVAAGFTLSNAASFLGGPAIGSYKGGDDMFATLVKTGPSPSYGPTWLFGGDGNDRMQGLAVAAGRPHGAGFSLSTNFPPGRTTTPSAGREQQDAVVVEIPLGTLGPVPGAFCDVYEERPMQDAGTPGGDGGEPSADGGVEDGGRGGQDGGGEEDPLAPLGWSCGCDASGGMSAVLLAVAASMVVARRRRHSIPSSRSLL